jgi:pimeloyl-ACP methyl ester carboxylesterase
MNAPRGHARNEDSRSVGRDRILQLRDGRELSYAEYGASAGTPVLYFHGLPGSRLDPELFAEQYLADGIRVVAPDRPGYGHTSPRRRWGLLDWVGDVVDLADFLGIGRFAVLGYSCGGKYAAACGFSIPERLSAVGILSGMGPPSMPGFRDGLDRADRLSMTLAMRARPLALLYWRLARRTVSRRPDSFVAEFEKELSDRDRVVIADPNFRRFLVDTTREALRQGPSGVVDDWAIQARDWGFGLDRIGTHVRFWHGDADESVPLSHSEHAAATIPNSDLTVSRGEGHLLINHFPEVVWALSTPRT